MKKIFPFFLLAFLAVSFMPAFAQETSSETQAIAEANKNLLGNWEWKESRFASRGVKPVLKTPASTNENVTIIFQPGNLVSLYINKKFSGTYQYTLTKPMNENLMIRFSGNEGQKFPEYLQEGPLYLTGNELTIAGGYNDAGLNVKFQKTGVPEKTTTRKTATKKAATKKTTAKKQK